MMNPVFQCPKCSNKLSNTYSCSYCSRVYFNDKEGFFDFSNNSLSIKNNSEKKLSHLLSEIQSHGFSKGLQQFLKNNSKFEYRFNKMEGDVAFRVIRKNNIRCLVLNSDLGNIPENLSQVFNEVYSLETDKEKILIQRFRFQENNIANIILIRSDVTSLPFPNKYFDLVVLNGIKIRKNGGTSKTKVIEHIKEIKRILTSDGCVCAAVGNKYGLKIYGTEKGDDLSNEFSASFYEYNSILHSLGFKVKPYWVLPSHRKPHYSGNIEDGISLKWFFHNFDKKFSVDRMKSRIVGLFLKGATILTGKLLVKFFCPSFLFYCHNESTPKVLEDMIIENTGFKNFIQYIRPRKVMYILLDRLGNPKKILSCMRTKYDLTEKAIPFKRTFSDVKHLKEKLVIEDWVEDNVLDRLNSNDINLAMKWLTNFQNSTSSELLSQQEIKAEIENLKKDLDKIEEMTGLPYHEWLDEYKDHISSIKLKKTAVHGDFQIRNIFVNRKNSSVDVIDWEWFQEKGNPLYDFMLFARNIMMSSNDMVEEFRSNLNGTGRAVPAIKIIKETMKKHFQDDLDFIILLRFFILQFIPTKIKDGTMGYLIYIALLKILSSKNH